MDNGSPKSRLFSTCRLEALHLFSCLPVCAHPCRFFRLSVCLLDGPLCHSATNGHCWASHFLNDTLLRSIQLPCSYTLTLLPLFSLPPLQSPPLPLMLDTVAYLPVWKKSRFLSIFPQCFPLNMPLDEETSSCLTHTHSHTHFDASHITGWMGDWRYMTVSLIAAPSPAGKFIHSSFIPLLIFISLIIVILLYVCVFCICAPLCVLAAEGGVARFLYCKLYSRCMEAKLSLALVWQQQPCQTESWIKTHSWSFSLTDISCPTSAYTPGTTCI